MPMLNTSKQDSIQFLLTITLFKKMYEFQRYSFRSKPMMMVMVVLSAVHVWVNEVLLNDNGRAWYWDWDSHWGSHHWHSIWVHHCHWGHCCRHSIRIHHWRRVSVDDWHGVRVHNRISVGVVHFEINYTINPLIMTFKRRLIAQFRLQYKNQPFNKVFIKMKGFSYCFLQQNLIFADQFFECLIRLIQTQRHQLYS